MNKIRVVQYGENGFVYPAVCVGPWGRNVGVIDSDFKVVGKDIDEILEIEF